MRGRGTEALAYSNSWHRSCIYFVCLFQAFFVKVCTFFCYSYYWACRS